jgi:hypothetical protein
VRESDLSLSAFLGDFECNLCPLPFALVIYEIDGAVCYEPGDPPPGKKLCYPLFRVMVRVVTVGELVIEFGGSPFDSRLPRPPSANVVDRSERLFRCLVNP